MFSKQNLIASGFALIAVALLGCETDLGSEAHGPTALQEHVEKLCKEKTGASCTEVTPAMKSTCVKMCYPGGCDMCCSWRGGMSCQPLAR